MPGGIVLIVRSDAARVETELVAGMMTCPVCVGVLDRWGFARSRWLRAAGSPIEVRPRRARCRSCKKTHVLLSDVALARRVDVVVVIGAALLAAARGAGFRRAAELIGRPATTVRGWLRRARAAAVRIREHFTRWAHALDASLPAIEPAGSALADAVAAVGVAARAASVTLGPRPAWSWASVLSGGRLLCNTSSPWPGP
jgi:transposase-like protein